MTGVEDQLEETELVLDGLREYHCWVKDRRRLEDEIEYNLQLAGQHVMAALTALRQLGDDDTADDLNDALTPFTVLTASTWIGTSTPIRSYRRSRPNSGRSAPSAPDYNGSRIHRLSFRRVRALINDDQSSVDEFTNERKRLREPYKCENCSEIKEYDPEIAGDAIPCHSCNSPSARSRANPDEAHMMRPRKGGSR